MVKNPKNYQKIVPSIEKYKLRIIHITVFIKQRSKILKKNNKFTVRSIHAKLISIFI